MKTPSQIKNLIRLIGNFFYLGLTKVWNFLVDYWHTLFPDYEKIRKDSGIKDDAVDYIHQLDNKIGKKYIVYRILLVLLILVMIDSIKNVIATKIFKVTLVLYINLQLWGLFMGFLGTIFLAKAFLKSKDQIVLESTSFGSKSIFAKSLIYSKYDTLVGLLFIGFSFLFQILALMFSVSI